MVNLQMVTQFLLWDRCNNVAVSVLKLSFCLNSLSDYTLFKREVEKKRGSSLAELLKVVEHIINSLCIHNN